MGHGLKKEETTLSTCPPSVLHPLGKLLRIPSPLGILYPALYISGRVRPFFLLKNRVTVDFYVLFSPRTTVVSSH